MLSAGYGILRGISDTWKIRKRHYGADSEALDFVRLVNASLCHLFGVNRMMVR